MSIKDLTIKVACRFFRAVTYPLPDSFDDSERALMTFSEYLEHQNPKGKSHPSTAYDWSIDKMNKDYSLTFKDPIYQDNQRYNIYESDGGYLYYLDVTGLSMQEGPLKAVVHQGTMYHEERKHPPAFHDMNVQKYKQVKYVSEYVPRLFDAARVNTKRYPVLLQRFKIEGETFTLRAVRQPEKNKGINLALLNSSGLVVAVAQREWGATLISVAKEYRRKGLGKLMGKYWYKYNPDFKSGGYTPAGRKMAKSLWEERVREFLSRGWYTKLVKEGRLSKARLDEILSDLGERSKGIEKLPTEDSRIPESDKDPLVYSDGTAFIIYDKDFLAGEDYDKKDIYAYGFFRSSSVGLFLYRIDYEPSYRKQAIYTALQMARDMGKKLYDGGSPSDFIELEGLKHIQREGDYIWLTKDVMPLEKFSRKEKTLRESVDPYDEKRITLIEKAEHKWN